MINRRLKKDLLKKLNCTRQALEARANRLISRLPMSLENATYLIAHTQGLKLQKYLTGDELEQVSKLQARLEGVMANISSTKQLNTASKTAKDRTILLKLDYKMLNKAPALSEAKIREAMEMAKVFAMLYLLENSIRSFLTIALNKFYGKDWWNRAAQGLHKSVDAKKNNEDKNPWLQKRSTNEIDYTDFNELITLANKVDQKLCEIDVLPRRNWLRDIIDEVYKSRCVLCHMNPLKAESIDLIRVNYTKWANQVNATLGKILLP